MGKPKKNTNGDSISSVCVDTSTNESNNDSDEVDIGNFSYHTVRRQSAVSQVFKSRHASFGLITFFALKVIFVDIFIAIGDVSTDFWQGIELLFRDGLENYGWIIIVANWVPGIVASMHILHMYRTKLPAQKTILFTVLAFVLWPILPLLAYILLLWRRPNDMSAKSTVRRISTISIAPDKFQSGKMGHSKVAGKGKRTLNDATISHIKGPTASEHEEIMSNFEAAEYYSMLASAISGGVESPIQFVTQMWLILTGRLDYPWEPNWYQFKDWNGNPINVPTTACFSLCFSVLAMIKAVVYFNIARVHVGKIENSRRMWWFLVSIFDHLPYFMASLIFKVGSILILAVYFPWGLIVAVPLIILCNLVIGYGRFNLTTMPLWLISFVALFFPACFTSQTVKNNNRHHLIRLQYSTFRRQSISSTVVLGIALIVTFYLVNFSVSYNYDSGVILDNSDFNMLIWIIAGIGGFSVFLSIKPSWIKLFMSLNEKVTKLDRLNSLDEPYEDSRRESVFEKPKRKSSSISIKSILKNPKLDVIQEVDEVSSAKSTPKTERKISEPDSDPEVDQTEMETINENVEPKCEVDYVDSAPNFSGLQEEIKDNEFEKEKPNKVVFRNSNETTKNEFEKSGTKLPSRRIIRIVGGMMLSLGIKGILLVPLSIHYLAKEQSKSYLFYQLPVDVNSQDQYPIQETHIIQGFKFNSDYRSNEMDVICGNLEKVGSFQTLKNYFQDLDNFEKSAMQLTQLSSPKSTASDGITGLGQDCSSNVIAVTCRSEWDRMSQKIAEDYRNKKLQAIIVVDDNIGCNDDKFKNCFRPSFPYPKVQPDALTDTPMMLVQGIDMYNIYKNWTQCWDVAHNAPDCEVGIAPSNDTIPNDLKEYTCVGTQKPCPGNGEKGKIPLDNFLKDKKINGIQKRRIRCMWGNKPCDDYTNQDEMEPFCNQHDVKDLFCDRFENELPLSWGRKEKNGEEEFGKKYRGRNFKPFSWKKDDFSKTCLNANNIDKCDTRPLGWSDCTEADNYGDRFRYCTISKKDYDVHNSCIIEEILNSTSYLCF